MSDSSTFSISSGAIETASVESLANALHSKKGRELEIEIPTGVQLQIPEGKGMSISQGRLCFSTLADRNRAVASYVFGELGESRCDQDSLWKAARDLWRCEIGHPDMASGRLLAAAQPHQDLLLAAASRMTSASEAFEVLNLVEAALPYMVDLDLDALLALCDVEQPLTRGDMAAGIFYGNLQQRLASCPAKACALVEKILAAPNQVRGNLLGAAWMAWFGNDPQAAARRLVAAHTRAEPLLSSLSCWIAGRMLTELTNEDPYATGLEDMILYSLSCANEQECRAGLAAATSLLHTRRRFDSVLREQISGGNHEAAAFVAQALSRNAEPLLATDMFFEWLPLCHALDETYAGALGALDYTLSKLLRPGSQHIGDVLEFLERWVVTQPKAMAGRDTRFANQFEQCAREILGQPQLCARLITQWMLTDGLVLPSAAAGLISRIERRQGGSTLRFDVALLANAAEPDLRFLGKRVLGFLIDAHHMLSLTLSLLDVTDAKNRVYPMMRWLLQHEIGYDYPSTTAEQLRTHAAGNINVEAKTLLLEIATEIEDRVAAIERLPRLRELAPPRTLRREFQKARAKQMEHSIREGRKNSVLASLMSTVHIKAGESSFQYLHNDFSQPMRFTSHSVSVELPRREVLDPVGNAYRIHRLRVAKRGDA